MVLTRATHHGTAREWPRGFRSSQLDCKGSCNLRGTILVLQFRAQCQCPLLHTALMTIVHMFQGATICSDTLNRRRDILQSKEI